MQMKIYYYFGSSRDDKEKNIVNAIYGDEIIYLYKKPWEFIDVLQHDDILICSSVEELTEMEDITSNVDNVVKEYMSIYNHGVELVFDKSTQCNSLFIKTLVSSVDEFEDTLRKCILNYINQKNIESKYAKKHKITADKNGTKLGIKKGTKLVTKRSIYVKEKIKELSKEYEGKLTDEELIRELGVARNTYFKYKKELKTGGI